MTDPQADQDAGAVAVRTDLHAEREGRLGFDGRRPPTPPDRGGGDWRPHRFDWRGLLSIAVGVFTLGISVLHLLDHARKVRQRWEKWCEP